MPSITMSNKLYDSLKWIARYLLPGFGTLYFGLAKIWGLPYGTEIVGTVSVLTTFMGVVLGMSDNGYQGEGTLAVHVTPDGKVVQTGIEFDVSAQDVKEAEMVTMRLVHSDSVE